MSAQRYDVVVVGGGNAAFCAAHAACEDGARVLMLEKAEQNAAGGNSYFTAGAFRTTFSGLEDLVPLLHKPDPAQLSLTDVPPYAREHFAADMERITAGRCDPLLTQILVEEAAPVVNWLHRKGIRWQLMYHRQAYHVNGRYRFWGGLVLGTVDGGVGLMEQHTTLATASGIEIRYGAPVIDLVTGTGNAVTGVIYESDGKRHQIEAGAVVLACGGFEADARLRAQYLGPNWDLAKVRGVPYNTGEGLMLAIELGAQPYGNWSGCHAIAWDHLAPTFGDRTITNLYSKQSYPVGVVVNQEGRRFLDEGADFRNYTYARYGAEILKQPGAVAYQLFDARTAPLLREDEYTAPGVARYEAPTITGLATLIGIDPEALETTIQAFNAAVQPGDFNPTIKDGKRTVGITPPKSNWAQPLDQPPFLAFGVTCGITFTFGGLKIDDQARVLDRADQPIPGLHAAGELVGGLFYANYPGGSGLTSGAVFGARAGHASAAFAGSGRQAAD